MVGLQRASRGRSWFPAAVTASHGRSTLAYWQHCAERAAAPPPTQPVGPAATSSRSSTALHTPPTIGPPRGTHTPNGRRRRRRRHRLLRRSVVLVTFPPPAFLFTLPSPTHYRQYSVAAQLVCTRDARLSSRVSV